MGQIGLILIHLANQSLLLLPNNLTIPILAFAFLFVDHTERLLVQIACFFGC